MTALFITISFLEKTAEYAITGIVCVVAIIIVWFLGYFKSAKYEKIEIENKKISSQNYFISEAEDKIIASVDSKKENTEEDNLKRKNKEKNHGLFLNKVLKIFKK